MQRYPAVPPWETVRRNRLPRTVSGESPGRSGAEATPQRQVALDASQRHLIILLEAAAAGVTRFENIENDRSGGFQATVCPDEPVLIASRPAHGSRADKSKHQENQEDHEKDVK